MNDRLLHYLARECSRLAARTATPRRARALVLRARRYLDAAHAAAPEKIAPRRRSERVSGEE
jgi:hypothetical protein